MRLFSYMNIAAIAVISATAAQAEDAVFYPYPSDANFCPEGLQPIVYGAEISCGTANTDVIWDSVIRHPVSTRYSGARSSQICLEGQKGC